MTTNNYSVLLEGVGHDPSAYIGVFLRGTFSHTGYTLFLRYGYNDLVILKHDGEVEWVLLSIENISLSLEEFY